VCFYDAVRADGSKLELGVEVAGDGTVREITPPPLTPMARTLWALRRESRADAGTKPRQVMAMLDAPFYSRSLVQTRIGGEDSTGVHEALDLRRFASPLLKPMLALRVPRRKGWTFPDRG
jgi:carotenoid 1,2-hydratase